MRAIVVASPTLDRVRLPNGVVRLQAGGPALYAGFALRSLGYEVCALGTYGRLVSPTVKLESSLGIRRLCCEGRGEGYVFAHYYDPESPTRRSTIESVSDPLTADDLCSALKECDPDLVIISPVYSEVPPELLSSSALKGRRVSVDVQGFSRSLGNGWWERLSPEHVSLVHLSNDDAGESVAESLARKFPNVLYTVGPGGALIYVGGKVTAVPSPQGNELLEDRTGAGDVMLALVSHRFLIQSLPLDEAYLRSQEDFLEIMRRISKVKVLGQS
ncbi:hypothetical protein [Acidilobus sp.]|uniref:hypothetical protein n=1 Tax=Acidilobus sp. TaxID=1872109 RepID=UPI003CFF3C1D